MKWKNILAGMIIIMWYIYDKSVFVQIFIDVNIFL